MQAPGGGGGQPGQAAASPLNQEQLAALHNFIRQKRTQNGGGDVTPAMVTEWMRSQNLLNGAQQQQQQQFQQQRQLDPQQQQLLLLAQQNRNQMLQQQAAHQHAQQQAQQAAAAQQQQQQQQAAGNAHDPLIAHLYPPHLQGNMQAALAHLQSLLFPSASAAQNTAQNPLLSQVLALAHQTRLSQEQMALLRTAVASRNNPQAQQPQQAIPQQQPQPIAQQPQAFPPQAQQQAFSQPPTQDEAQRLVSTLNQRVNSLENLLKRTDIIGPTREKAQAELEASRAQLHQVVKQFLQQNQQAQTQQQQSQQQQDLQQQQRAAMAQREQEIRQRTAQAQAQAQAQAAAAAGGGAQNFLAAQAQAQGQYRTGSPSQFPPNAQQQPPRPASNSNAPSPVAPSPGSAADQAKVAAVAAAKKQQQAQQQAQAQQMAKKGSEIASAATAQQQQKALAAAQQQQAALAAGQQQQQQAPTGPAPAPAPIPNQLSMPPTTAENFTAPRPTLHSGLANSPVVSTPAITRPAFLSSSSGIGGGAGGEVKKEEDGTSKLIEGVEVNDGDKGRTVQKRKIRELLESIDPKERLDGEVEDLLLDVADEFIDSITRFACQLAKHRKSDRLEVNDLALHLDRSYNIKIPGFGPEETRGSVRRAVIPPGHLGRLAAVRDQGRRR